MVAKGFKNTEIGVIPEDWEVRSLGDLGKFSKGSGVRKDESLSGTIPCVRYGEIYTRHNDYIKRFYSFISSGISDTATKLRTGDILFAGSGETKAEIGKSVAFIDNFEAYAGGDIVILSLKDIHALFVGYLLNAPFIQKQKANRGQGDAVVHISANQLSDVKIPLPTLPEQKAIAEALSDADAWIANLEQLIAKKRLIKQGAMQQLLSPKEDWEVKKLGEVLDFGNGKDYKHLSSGDIPVYGTGGIMTYVNESLYEGDSVGIGRKGTIDKPVFLQNKFWTVDTLFFTHTFRNVSPKYIFYQFLLIPWKEYNEASGVPSLNKKTLEQIKIKIPSLTEQTRIATILSDMDSEIESLENQLAKARQIKQGMMQELLTGRVRLV